MKLHLWAAKLTFNDVDGVSLLQIPHTYSSILITHHSPFTCRNILIIHILLQLTSADNKDLWKDIVNKINASVFKL